MDTLITLFVKSFEKRYYLGKEVFSTPRVFSPVFYLLVGVNYAVTYILEGKWWADHNYRQSLDKELENYYPEGNIHTYYPLRRFRGLEYAPTRIKHLWSLVKSYAPVLYHDQDFDYVYLLKLMEVKMTRMAKALDKGHLVGSEKRARELRVYASLLKRIHEDNYSEIPLKRLEEEYGKTEYNSKPTDNPYASELIIERTRAKRGTKEYEEEHKKSMRIHKHAEQMKENDKNYLFDNLKKKLFYYWD